MSYTTGTTNYDLPQYVGTDTPSWTDTNEGFAELDSAVGGAVSTLGAVGDRVTALETTVTGDGGVTETITSIQSDITTLNGTVSGHTTSITNLGIEVDDVRSDCEDMITANEEASATSTTAYAVDDYFRYNDVLYKCTVAIGVGDTIVPNTNCEATNVVTELNQVNNDLNKGEVSVTGDGTKTYTQLLNELYGLVDRTKLDGKSYFVGAYGLVAKINGLQTSYIGFNSTDVELSALKSTSIGLKPSASFVYSFNGTTVTDNSSNVVASGTVLKVVY